MKKCLRFVSMLLAIMMIASCVSVYTSAASEQLDIYVAVNGTGDGLSAASPTDINKVVTVFTKQLNKGGKDRNVVIHFTNGVHTLEKTMRLSSGQCVNYGYNVTFLGGSDTVISGGTDVSGWKKESGNIYSAPLTGIDLAAGFYLNGKRFKLAEQKVTATAGILDNPKYVSPKGAKFYDLVVDIAGDIKGDITSEKNLQVSFIDSKAWYFPKVQMKSAKKTSTGYRLSATKEGSCLTMEADYGYFGTSTGQNCYLGYNVAFPGWVYNAKAFLDEDGEYYYSKDEGKLYICSSTDPNGKEAVVPTVDRLVEIEGLTNNLAHDITFQNIQFKYGADTSEFYKSFGSCMSDYGNVATKMENELTTAFRDASVVVSFARDIKFINDNFEHMNCDGINMPFYDYCCNVENCYFNDLSGSAFQLGKGQNDDRYHPIDPDYEHKKKLTIDATNGSIGECHYPAGITLSNNYIIDTGVEYQSSAGISAHTGWDVYIEDNTIINSRHNAIFITPFNASTFWGWYSPYIGNFFVRRNRLDNYMCGICTDGGGIYHSGGVEGDGSIDYKGQEKAPDGHYFGSLIEGNYAVKCASNADPGAFMYQDNASCHIVIKDNVSLAKNWLQAHEYSDATGKGQSLEHDCICADNFYVAENEMPYVTEVTHEQRQHWMYGAYFSNAAGTIQNYVTDPKDAGYPKDGKEFATLKPNMVYQNNTQIANLDSNAAAKKIADNAGVKGHYGVKENPDTPDQPTPPVGSETEKPETKKPETKGSETKKPETKAPETQSGDYSFSDVKANDWFSSYVQDICKSGIMKGTGDDTFSPSKDTKRGDFVLMLYRYEGEPSVSASNPFVDIKSSDYYKNAVLWANANGIVKGTSSNAFSAKNPVTREQIALILYNYADSKGWNVSELGDVSSAPDAAKIHDWALTAMKWAKAAGMIGGDKAGNLTPRNNAVRSQVAKIFVEFMNSYENKPETKQETKAPETKKPETKTPETKKPETKTPETKAPETKAPETKAPETKAPETQPQPVENHIYKVVLPDGAWFVQFRSEESGGRGVGYSEIGCDDGSGMQHDRAVQGDTITFTAEEFNSITQTFYFDKSFAPTPSTFRIENGYIIVGDAQTPDTPASVETKGQETQPAPVETSVETQQPSLGGGSYKVYIPEGYAFVQFRSADSHGRGVGYTEIGHDDGTGFQHDRAINGDTITLTEDEINSINAIFLYTEKFEPTELTRSDFHISGKTITVMNAKAPDEPSAPETQQEPVITGDVTLTAPANNASIELHKASVIEFLGKNRATMPKTDLDNWFWTKYAGTVRTAKDKTEGELSKPKPVKFTWTGANSGTIEIAENSSFTQGKRSYSISGNSIELTNFKTGTTYY